LAVLEPPGAIGADIAVGEGQPLGLPPQYGGPGVGLFACRNDRKYLQQVPGRLVGETVDKHGRRGFVLTLATREQHIRRERATSNICTNSGLCATAVTIKMCMLGKSGFVEAARACLAKAEYLKARFAALPGYSLLGAAPTFNEFVVTVPGGDASNVVARLTSAPGGRDGGLTPDAQLRSASGSAPHSPGIVPGLDLGRFFPARRGELLVAVTERHTRADLDRLIDALAAPRG
jgi:glycine dehydrogenase subunit 1